MEIKKYQVAKGDFWENYIGKVGQWHCVSKSKYTMLKFFGYKVRVDTFRNGDNITITWLPACVNGRGTKNPYIGMSGLVEELKQNGEFVLNTGTSYLVCSGKLNYIKND